MTGDSTGLWVSPRGNTTLISLSQNPATRYEFTIPAVGGNDDNTPEGDVVHADKKNGKSKRMPAE